ncbi:hypothetical protein F5Y04DRAFT_240885 [Hypomontagnella monticulosa]|nr:hypothetical protein F5Y04DRAFT_240885 [Hypomontagnella monticulosa]
MGCPGGQKQSRLKNQLKETPILSPIIFSTSVFLISILPRATTNYSQSLASPSPILLILCISYLSSVSRLLDGLQPNPAWNFLQQRHASTH